MSHFLTQLFLEYAWQFLSCSLRVRFKDTFPTRKYRLVSSILIFWIEQSGKWFSEAVFSDGSTEDRRNSHPNQYFLSLSLIDLKRNHSTTLPLAFNLSVIKSVDISKVLYIEFQGRARSLKSWHGSDSALMFSAVSRCFWNNRSTSFIDPSDPSGGPLPVQAEKAAEW